jgi:hypothetical protein
MFTRLSLLRVLLALVISCGSLLALPMIVSAQDSPQVCQFPFEATVRQGQSAGTSLIGDMTLNIDPDGAFTGTLVTSDAEIPVSGQIVGRAISLVMELAPVTQESAGSYIFGTGAARDPILGDPNCGGPLGGTFAGPGLDDMGTWIKVEVCVIFSDGSGVCVSVEITRR